MKFKRRAAMLLRAKAECIVSGSLALNLAISSVLGIAPVRLIKRRDGWGVRVSPLMRLYSYAFITVIDILNVWGAISYYQNVLLAPSRKKTYVKRVVWISDIGIIAVITTILVYTAPKKMHRFIKYNGKIRKINEGLKLICQPRSSEKTRYFFNVVYLLSGIIIFILDFAYVLESANVKHTKVGGLTYFKFLGYGVLQVIQMQFILITWTTYNTFHHISRGLSKLLLEKQTAELLNSVHIQTSDNIHRLALAYCETCDVVKKIDKSFGFTVLLLLVLFLLHLVVTPYHLIISMYDVDNTDPLPMQYKNFFLQFTWCVFHTCNLIAIVEPCQRMITEVQTIKKLVSHLMRSNSIHEPDFTELNLFYNYLFLNNPCYAPLKICTLNRALVATILSSITTYLVLLIQM